MTYATSSLKTARAENKILRIYEKYQPDFAKVVTRIWTSDTILTSQEGVPLYKLINAALVLDASEHFEWVNDISWTEFVKEEYKVTTRNIKEGWDSCAYYVLRNSIKFMRLLNTAIVDLGMLLNRKDRTTYRGLPVSVFNNVKEGGVYRMITWQWSSDDFEWSKKHFGSKTLIQFNIKEIWWNAGVVNGIGMSKFQYESETLMPPYTAIHVRKINPKEGISFEIDVAQDNARVDFQMEATT